MQLDMGLGAAAFGGGYAAAQTPAAAQASPQGPTTIGQKAFGIVTGSEGGSSTGAVALVSAGGLSLALLWFIWYSLPR
jgi:uncharacterized membrane protein YedE/YeeE